MTTLRIQDSRERRLFSGKLGPPVVNNQYEKMAGLHEGGCLCGNTRYRVDGKPFNVCYCHCRSCRRASGGAFVPWMSVGKKDFQFQGTDPVKHNSSDGIMRTFCGRCGTSLTYEQIAADSIDIAVTTLDDPGTLTPTCHIWVSDKLPWINISDGLPQYRAWRSTASGETDD